MDSLQAAQRPFRRSICDGDDVWPASLTDDDLRAIAAIDAAVRASEPHKPPEIREILGDAPALSVAERVRCWKRLVEDTETGVNLHPGEYMTELGCREYVADRLAQLPDTLREKLMSDLLDPLDARFKLATVDDGGDALNREVKLGDVQDLTWWWRRRPISFGPLWKRQPD